PKNVTPPAPPLIRNVTPQYQGPPLIMNKSEEPPKEEEPGPEEPDEDPEDSEKPPSPSAAAAHSAEQAALYAWDAHQYASRIMGIFADAILKALPSEHDKVDQISELLADASDAAGLAQAAADQAAGAAAEASASPDTAEFNAGIAAADAT